jgi:hypothetical protein
VEKSPTSSNLLVAHHLLVTQCLRLMVHAAHCACASAGYVTYTSPGVSIETVIRSPLQSYIRSTINNGKRRQRPASYRQTRRELAYAGFETTPACTRRSCEDGHQFSALSSQRHSQIVNMGVCIYLLSSDRCPSKKLFSTAILQHVCIDFCIRTARLSPQFVSLRHATVTLA